MGILCKYFIDFEFKQTSFLRNYSTLLIFSNYWLFLGRKGRFPFLSAVASLRATERPSWAHCLMNVSQWEQWLCLRQGLGSQGDFWPSEHVSDLCCPCSLPAPDLRDSAEGGTLVSRSCISPRAPTKMRASWINALSGANRDVIFFSGPSFKMTVRSGPPYQPC